MVGNGSDNTQVRFNTFHGNGGNAVELAMTTGVSVRDNLFSNNTGWAISGAALGAAGEPNGFWQNGAGNLSSGAPGATSVIGDPRYVSVAARRLPAPARQSDDQHRRRDLRHGSERFEARQLRRQRPRLGRAGVAVLGSGAPMKLSIRYQILLLVAAILSVAMVSYLSLANRLFAQDKLAYVYDVNRLLAQTLSEEVHTQLESLVDKLQYYGQEQLTAPAKDRDRPARVLFAADADVLALEVFARGPKGFVSAYRYEPEDRLAAHNLAAADLEAARRDYPLDPAAIAAVGTVLRNGSRAPDALIRLGAATDDRSVVVIAELLPDRFLRIFERSRQHHVSLVDARGEYLVNPAAPAKVLDHANASAHPLVKLALESELALQMRELDGPDGAVLGTYAHVPGGRMTVLVEVAKAEALRATRELERRSVLFGLFVLCAGFLASIFLSRRLTAPLRQLEQATRELSKGELGVQVRVKSRNEIGTLALAFNRMSQELQAREAQLLETHAQLVQSEKLSALGEMAAGLAHEVKNPMVGILGFSELGQTVSSLDEAKEYFTLIHGDSTRANEILMNLLSFARPEKLEVEPLAPRAVVDGAVKLVHHPLMMKGVKVHVRHGERLPEIEGNSNQLRQVLLNLMMNAGHAMEHAPEKQLHLATEATADGGVTISVRDTGSGMTPEVREKLFKPFFTTKEHGKGTGLGLSVSRSIVHAHGGEITVESEPGQGTTFFVRLPGEVGRAGGEGLDRGLAFFRACEAGRNPL